MGVGLLIGLFLITVLLFFFIWLFIYYKKRNSKVGIIFSSIGLVCIILIFFTNNIDELTISKADVKKDLKLLNIELNSSFEINENIVNGMPERNQKTEISASGNYGMQEVAKTIGSERVALTNKDGSPTISPCFSLNQDSGMLVVSAPLVGMTEDDYREQFKLTKKKPKKSS